MFNMFIWLSLLLAFNLLLVEGTCPIAGSGNSFTWESPNYPTSNYPKNMNCSFPSDASAPRITHYTLTEFLLQDKTREKCQDHVTFTKPFHKQIKVCGNMTGETISIPMGASSANFTSNNKIIRKGFSISVDYETTAYTKEVELSMSGDQSFTVTNPAHPNMEKGHLAEYWVKTNDPGKKIRLYFEVNIKKKMCCNQDYLVINRDGDPIYPKATSRLYCGIRNSTLASKANKMSVSFRSDDPGRVKLTFVLVGSS